MNQETVYTLSYEEVRDILAKKLGVEDLKPYLWIGDLEPGSCRRRIEIRVGAS